MGGKKLVYARVFRVNLAVITRTMRKNLFIALEGIDGSGKSTQSKLLAEELKRMGHKVYTTFEPTDSYIGSIIRDILKGKRQADELTIAGLFVADRLDHLLCATNGILMKLEEGYTVITDRYYFSSYAYNGAMEDMDWVIAANARSASLLRPDIHLFIDIAPEIALKRVHENREATELYETAEKLEQVRHRYLVAFERFKDEENIVFVDGNQTQEQTGRDVQAKVVQLMDSKK